METLRIVYDGIEKVIPFLKGDTLLSVLRKNGYEISANCGGNGTCNKCKVYLMEGENVTAVSSCKTLAKAGMRVIVPSVRGEGLVTDAKTQTDGESGIGLALDIGTTTLAFYFVDFATGARVHHRGSEEKVLPDYQIPLRIRPLFPDSKINLA